MVILIEVANLTKYVVGAIVNFALMAKKKQPEKTTRSKLGEKYLNCEKKVHYIKDCRSSTLNKKKSKKLIEEGKWSR